MEGNKKNYKIDYLATFFYLWKKMPLGLRYAMPYIISAFLTFIQQLLNGLSLRDALATFVSSLLLIINGLKAIKKTKKEKIKKANAQITSP